MLAPSDASREPDVTRWVAMDAHASRRPDVTRTSHESARRNNTAPASISKYMHAIYIYVWLQNMSGKLHLASPLALAPV